MRKMKCPAFGEGDDFLNALDIGAVRRRSGMNAEIDAFVAADADEFAGGFRSERVVAPEELDAEGSSPDSPPGDVRELVASGIASCDIPAGADHFEAADGNAAAVPHHGLHDVVKGACHFEGRGDAGEGQHAIAFGTGKPG